MCLIFNPTEPHAINPWPCQLCTSVPKYWRLIVPAFTAFPGTNEAVDYVEDSIVLEWERRDADGPRCYWGPRFDLVQHTGLPRTLKTGSFFHIAREWNLKTYGSYEWQGSILPNTVFPFWHVTHAGKTVWGRTIPFGVNRDPDVTLAESLGNYYTHFHCRAKNRLWYIGSIGDIGGEEFAQALGVPRYIEIEPYTP